jgi:hypothetical protein
MLTECTRGMIYPTFGYLPTDKPTITCDVLPLVQTQGSRKVALRGWGRPAAAAAAAGRQVCYAPGVQQSPLGVAQEQQQ